MEVMAIETIRCPNLTVSGIQDLDRMGTMDRVIIRGINPIANMKVIVNKGNIAKVAIIRETEAMANIDNIKIKIVIVID
jgi:hypothetical protein